jgi:hypothetical protein
MADTPLPFDQSLIDPVLLSFDIASLVTSFCEIAGPVGGAELWLRHQSQIFH